ncbi:uncharacterized protein NDAI_0H03590 [Naumovozyma dairenensis CBS 421]|uniref:Peptide hydrolase n=1 Tax=Naumovozyma dairenensis (strain ATCC 10597 / BCRC 20456 / CBS 421 / NBRC 0211 / NRRL Y-12639) TaxID=1071378 RepID=G0WFH1_NAUDC|nr:hypothetical protein NDAI_0H03590 [Naumovozyma dairenensis CBS 421]CCD26532.1 hypothetical protein NDAI_0H03590 [Naumovozyma dairenensis CBS 421]
MVLVRLPLLLKLPIILWFFFYNIDIIRCEKILDNDGNNNDWLLNSSGSGLGISQLKYHEENLYKELNIIPKKDEEEKSHNNLILPFNGTRVPGSLESLKIQDYIINHFNNTLKLNWTIELDNFQENGYNFTNMIFSLLPGNNDEDTNMNDKYLVLAVHYDTMIKPEGFIGAMDSGASCGILLYLSKFIDTIYSYDHDDDMEVTSTLAYSIGKKWHKKKNIYDFTKLYDDNSSGTFKGIKIIFFDGEEAIEKWSDDDSIYGSRHLAKKWQEQKQTIKLKNGTIIETNELDNIEVFVLLDLLGSKSDTLESIMGQRVPSYYSETHMHYGLLSTIEGEYFESNISSRMESSRIPVLDPSNLVFEQFGMSVIGDDHLPFYDYGVPILHLIPYPFPSSWHTMSDTFANLDQEQVNRWAIILSEFTLSWMSS